MSAPESGKTETDVEPLGEVMWIGILGAGSVAVTWLILEMSRSLPVESSLVDVVGTDSLGFDGGYLLRHTFAKWPNLPQLLHGSLNAGHLALPLSVFCHHNPGILVGNLVLCERGIFYGVSVGYVQLQPTPDVHWTC